MQPRLQMLFIIYYLDNLPKNPSNNFKIKSCLFGATNIAKNSNESKHGQSSYRITLDGADSCSFGNEFIKNVIIFGVDNSSSSHKDNHQNGFLVLGEGPAEQNFSIYFSKPKTKFCLKQIIKISIFQLKRVQEVCLINLTKLSQKKHH